MNTTIQALQALYVKLSGLLTDVYENIASGEQVGNYTTIPDMIEACTQKAESGGGGSSSVEAIEFEYAGEIGSAQTLTSVKTAAEIFALAQNSTGLIAVAEAGEGAFMQAVVGAITATTLQLYLPSDDNMISVTATAASSSDHFVATIGS